MSITVTLFSKAELKRFAEGEISQRSTIFLNQSGYIDDQIKIRRQMKGVKKYCIIFNAPDAEDVNFYAQNKKMAIWFATHEYRPEFIEAILQVVTHYKAVFVSES